MNSKNQNNSKMIRNFVIFSLVLLCSFSSFSQSVIKSGMMVKEVTKVKSIAIVVTADSAKDLESTFKIEDLKDVLEYSDENESISLKIVCNGKTMSNGKKSNVSYQIEGNSNNSENFIKSAEIIRSAAIKYYKNKH